jgi:hypothetical protein
MRWTSTVVCLVAHFYLEWEPYALRPGYISHTIGCIPLLCSLHAIPSSILYPPFKRPHEHTSSHPSMPPHPRTSSSLIHTTPEAHIHTVRHIIMGECLGEEPDKEASARKTPKLRHAHRISISPLICCSLPRYSGVLQLVRLP